ncbi:hypothetical protein MMC25_005447 [Agyrium rufum]|nr:hypothetical protein [Agyrium rufum]
MRSSTKYVSLLLATPYLVQAADNARPRGVGPEFGKYYKSTDFFTCITSPSIKIPISHINDDFCDCPDGSDEPGTSACSYLSPLSPQLLNENSATDLNATIALPGFYCKNKGHQPSYVPFLSVNDGVCDYDLCCDGSDEWAKVGGHSCPDKCKEIGKDWRKKDEVRQRALGNGAKKRKELVQQADRLRQEIQDRIQTIVTQLEGASLKIKGFENQLDEVERQERGRMVRSKGKGNRVTVLAGLTKGRIEELREALIEVRGHKDQYRDRIVELEEILSKFKEEYNPNFNDEGVKRAVRAWEDYAAKETADLEDPAYIRDLDEMTKPDPDGGGIEWEEWEKQDDSDVDLIYKLEAYLPPSLRTWIDDKMQAARAFLVENGMLAASAKSDTESKAVADARSALKSAEDDLKKIRDNLKKHEEDLAYDFGVDDVFRSMKGQCVSKDSGEYTYELCWMDKTSQKSKKGHSNTGLGNFARIESITVDDELPPDGKGLGSGERVVLKYENGQHCWNGPARSTAVILACAEENEIWKVVEEEKCVYRMEVGSPAVCVGNGSKKEKGSEVKDEL